MSHLDVLLLEDSNLCYIYLMLHFDVLLLQGSNIHVTEDMSRRVRECRWVAEIYSDADYL